MPRVDLAASCSYRAVLRNGEFRALLLSQALSTAGNQLARVAVALLVFSRTGSGLAAAATYAVSYLTYLVGGPVLSALSDRHPRRTVMVVCDLLRFPLVLLLCLPGLPLWSVFGCLVLLGVLAPPFDSARSAVQPEILLDDAYVTGSALINIVMQLGEVLGFVAGGALVAATSVRGALLLDAATFLVSAAALALFVEHRPAAQAAHERGSLLGDTFGGLRVVRSSPFLVRYLTFSVIASAGLIAPEGLAVPMAHALHGGAVAAGILTASVSVGFVLGSLLVVRLPPERRLRLLLPLSLLALVPPLLTPLAGSVPQVAALWALAGLGASVNLVASAAYVQCCPPEFRSRAYGVAVTTVFTSQGLALLASGALADAFTPAGAVAILAAAALVVLLLSPVVRAPLPPVSQGEPVSVRGTPG